MRKKNKNKNKRRRSIPLVFKKSQVIENLIHRTSIDKLKESFNNNTKEITDYLNAVIDGLLTV